MLTLVEELSLRTRRVQAMMRQMEESLARMDEIRGQLRMHARHAGQPRSSGRTSAASCAT